jgi:hypothetical protein
VGVRRRPIGRSPVWAQVAGRLLRGDDVVRLRVRLQGAAAQGELQRGFDRHWFLCRDEWLVSWHKFDVVRVAALQSGYSVCPTAGGHVGCIEAQACACAKRTLTSYYSRS